MAEETERTKKSQRVNKIFRPFSVGVILLIFFSLKHFKIALGFMDLQNISATMYMLVHDYIDS